MSVGETEATERAASAEGLVQEQPSVRADAPGEPLRPETPAERRRNVGRLCGLLFIIGATIAFPSSLLIEPAVAGWFYAIAGLGFVSGAACLLIPWERIDEKAIHIVAAAGTIEVAVAIKVAGTGGDPYWWFYVFIAVFAGYVFRSRWELAAQLALNSLATMAPAVYDQDSARHSLAVATVAVPSLIVAGGIVFYVRARMERTQDAYRQLSRQDPLTGVGNYRAMHERLEYEIARHRRHRRRFALLLLDLDGFKDVNESHGHLEGDRVLRDVGELLAGEVRDQDTVARQGGDEFSVLAPETGAQEAVELAVRISAALGRIVAGQTTLTACSGWAIYPDDGETSDLLISHADAALLYDKRQRRAADQLDD